MSSDLIKEIPRILVPSLPPGKSAFLWGPRKTGKTTLLASLYPESVRFDLLESDTFLKYSKEPHRFREEMLAIPEKKLRQPVIIDEAQKIPSLLDEVHLLIEKKKIRFILCGSSARKLKKTHANLLGGRARRYILHPLTRGELGSRFDLLRCLNHGLIPDHYLTDDYEPDIKAYIADYLREEIQQEGLVRNLPAFARFLDTVPFSIGELVNYTNIARECFVDSKTVAEYYHILEDTLVGQFLEPFRKRRNRQIIYATPKFYLFDVGVAGQMMGRKISDLKGPEFGKAFEHFIAMELFAHASYSGRDYKINFWRTNTGLEADFVLDGGRIAVECKGTASVGPGDLTGLKAFREEYKPQKAILVCREKVPRRLDSGIVVLPWEQFLDQLWGGELT